MQRWNDDRLDDLANRVNKNSTRLDALTEIMVSQAELRQQLVELGKDTSACLQKLETMELERGRREDDQRKERKADRRWLIGTALTVCVIVVAALGVFLG